MRYLDTQGLTLTADPLTLSSALALQYDTTDLPDQFKPGDSIITSPFNLDRWRWLPKWVDVIIEPDGGKLERQDPLTYALKQRNLNLTYRTKPPSERSKNFDAYNEAVTWATSLGEHSRIDVGNLGQGSVPYELITDPERASNVLRELRGKPYAFDYETTALNPREACIVGVALADEHMSWYIAGEGLRALPDLVSLLMDGSSQASAWNAKYEYSVTACQLGVEPTSLPPVIDPMIMHHIWTSENRGNGLKEVTRKIFGRSVMEFSDVVPKGTSIEDVPLDLLARYAAAGDARNTYDLHGILRQKLIDDSLLHIYEKFEWRLTPVLAEMELAGLPIDQAKLEELILKVEKEVHELASVIQALGFQGSNLNSDAQVARWLYEELGLPVLIKTKTGAPSVGADALRRLRNLHPAAEVLIAYNKATQLLSTFLLKARGVPMIYVSFNQTSTGTGRLSSSGNGYLEPKRVNAQNWPISVRDIVVSPPGHIIWARDYNQIEPRIAAFASGDPAMLNAYRNGEDPYIGLGIDMGFDAEKLRVKEPVTRRTVKAEFLGWMYGARGPKLVETAAKQDVRLTVAEAEKAIRKLEENRPRFVKWRREVIERARETGASYSLFGRRRLLPKIWSKDPTTRAEAEREAVNEVPQGTGADIIKAAMPKVHAIVKAAQGTSRIQVHDELVGMWSEEMERELGPVLDAVMTENELGIPLKVESETGKSWGSAKPH